MSNDTTKPVYIQFDLPSFNAAQLTASLLQNGFTANLLQFEDKAKQRPFTYISLHEHTHLTLKNGELITSHNDQKKSSHDSLKSAVEQLLLAFQSRPIPALPGFYGGFIGYFGYDYARYVNKTLPQHPNDPFNLADADLSFVDQTFIYDHRRHQASIVQLIPKNTSATEVQHYQQQLTKLKAIILNLPVNKMTFALKTPFTMAFDASTFTEKVQRAKRHIYDGDIFQMILANRQHATMTGSLLALAEDFFKTNQTPYQFYYHADHFEAIGASPETLVTKTGQKLFTYPLAGTRRRGKMAQEEQQFMQELTHDPKEIAEHNMLVDLGRNDLGRVSQFGSVRVTKLRQLLKFSQVMHLGSTIESLCATPSAMAIIDALLPAGTLSGAPKISAMQLIYEAEQQKRGLYGGCLGYLSTTGDLDLCIGIRLAYRQGADLFVHSGAGIVADSRPEQEYLEFNNKARAIMLALRKGTGDAAYALSRG